MQLNQDYVDGRFFDKSSDLIAFDPGIFEATFLKVLLVKKEKLCNFLKMKKYSIFWTLLGEKNMIGGEYSGRKWIGRLELSGAYTLDKDQKIVGTINSKFKK